MEAFIDFFENIPTSFRAGILIGGIFIFWIVEGVFPLFDFGYKKVRHAGINAVLTAFFVVIGLGFAGALLAASDFVTQQEFVLLNWVALPIGA